MLFLTPPPQKKSKKPQKTNKTKRKAKENCRLLNNFSLELGPTPWDHDLVKFKFTLQDDKFQFFKPNGFLRKSFLKNASKEWFPLTYINGHFYNMNYIKIFHYFNIFQMRVKKLQNVIRLNSFDRRYVLRIDASSIILKTH